MSMYRREKKTHHYIRLLLLFLVIFHSISRYNVLNLWINRRMNNDKVLFHSTVNDILLGFIVFFCLIYIFLHFIHRLVCREFFSHNETPTITYRFVKIASIQNGC